MDELGIKSTKLRSFGNLKRLIIYSDKILDRWKFKEQPWDHESFEAPKFGSVRNLKNQYLKELQN